MELVKQITCSLSEKIQHESYGGAKYTSTDLFESESEQVPTTMDFDEVQVVWNVLRRRVEARIGERKRELIASLGKGGYQTPSAPQTPISVAPTDSQAPSTGHCLNWKCVNPVKPEEHGRSYCYPCRQAFKNGAVPAQPKEVIPDTPSGEPFAS